VLQPEGMHAMADQDSPAQLRATGAMNGASSHGATAVDRVVDGKVADGKVTNGKVAKRDSDDIVAEIERTRQNLARTIDSLADRVSPSSNVRRLREQVADQASRPEVQLAALAVALTVTGVAIYRIWGRRRS
jgi:Protein of unknown function (DUF3618)